MKKTMKFVLLVCAALLACTMMFTACDGGDKPQESDETTADIDVVEDSTMEADKNDDASEETSQEPGVPPHVHNFGEWEVIQNATCTATGSKDRYCSCGEKQTATIPVTEHTFGDWTVTQAPTKTDKGTEERSCSCGEKEIRDVDILPTVTTVTRQEWENAFDLSTYGNIIATVDASFVERGSEWTTKGTLTAKNGIVYRNYVATFEGEEEKVQDSSAGTLSMEELDTTGVLSCVVYSLSCQVAYGYTTFDYEEGAKAYCTEVDVDCTPCDVMIWFEDAKIVKITCKGQDSTQIVDCTYLFSYDAT